MGGYIQVVEVIVSDSLVWSHGSQFGHVAISVDGVVYSRAHNLYNDKKTYIQYIDDQRSFRDSVGIVLAVTPEEKSKIKTELQRRVLENRNYGIIENNCATNVVEVLAIAGIIANDPRFIPGLVTPTDMIVALTRSNINEDSHNLFSGVFLIDKLNLMPRSRVGFMGFKEKNYCISDP